MATCASKIDNQPRSEDRDVSQNSPKVCDEVQELVESFKHKLEIMPEISHAFETHEMMCRFCCLGVSTILLISCGHFQACEICFKKVPELQNFCLKCGQTSMDYIKVRTC